MKKTLIVTVQLLEASRRHCERPKGAKQSQNRDCFVAVAPRNDKVLPKAELLPLIAIFMVLSVFMPHSISAGEIAIIINKQNLINDISYNDLVKIFKQERQYWQSGKRIYLVMREAGESAKKMVLKKIYKMNDEELKKLWLAKLFRGEISSFPKSLGSEEAVKRFVSRVPNAVSFIASESLDDSIKVLRIDGKLPKDKGYILAGESENED